MLEKYVKKIRISKCYISVREYIIHVNKQIKEKGEFRRALKKYYKEKVNYKKIHFLRDEEALDLLKQGKSLCRFGDGEIGWLLERHSYNAFKQENSKLLSSRLKEVLQCNDEDILVGVPNVFDGLDFLEDWAIPFNVKALAEFGKDWMQLLHEDRMYCDSRMTRLYGDVKDKSNCEMLFRRWKSVFRDNDIVIIEGEYTRFGVGNDLLNTSKSVRRILAPAENAFEKYEKILDVAKEMDKKVLFLIALGPTATILAYDLYRKGYQAIDIGHLDIEYEWFLRKMPHQSCIPGKYVGESIQNQENYMLTDKLDKKPFEKYCNSVIMTIR